MSAIDQRQPTLQSICNVEVEEAILSSLLSTNDLFLTLDLTSDDFYRQQHRILFEAMKELHADGKSIDMITLHEKLKAIGQFEAVGGMAMLTHLSGMFFVRSNAAQYAQTLREYAERRRLYRLSLRLQEISIDTDNDIVAEADKIASELVNLQAVSEEYTSVETATMAAIDRLMDDSGGGLKTGIESLDRVFMHGWLGGQLVILAGRPSMGKTALALNFIYNIIKQDKRCLLFSLETSAANITERLILRHASVSREDVFSDRDNSRQKAIESAGYFAQQKDKLIISDRGRQTVESISVLARKLKARGGLDFIAIDHLQLLSADGFKNDRLAEITYITRRLKELSMSMGIPILLLSQLNRGVERRDNKRPMMSDLRESGSIEQDADIVMLLYREGYYKKDEDKDAEDNVAEVNIAKQKDGATKTVFLEYCKEYHRFSYIPFGSARNESEVPV